MTEITAQIDNLSSRIKKTKTNIRINNRILDELDNSSCVNKTIQICGYDVEVPKNEVLEIIKLRIKNNEEELEKDKDILKVINMILK